MNTTREIIIKYLKDNKFDGLYFEAYHDHECDCSCLTGELEDKPDEDLCTDIGHCTPGYLQAKILIGPFKQKKERFEEFNKIIKGELK